MIGRAPDLWRYRELLPVKHPENIVTLGEGMTPLLKLNRLGAEVGLEIAEQFNWKLRETGWIEPNEIVVLLNTGSGLKYPETVQIEPKLLAIDDRL